MTTGDGRVAAAARPDGPMAGSPPDTGMPGVVGVIGGGRMGAGIAQVFAAVGAAVTIVEADPAAAGSARDRVAAGLRRAAGKGRLAETADAVLERVNTTADVTGLPGDADLVVEAVPENADLKVRDKVARGELGRKAGVGFYQWEAPS
jgi:3-hydroxybutyryl-CoA dehydrogenase